MKRFKVTAIRTDEYIIELDETKFDDEWRKEFGKYFHKIDELEDVVRDLAWHQMKNGDERFLEGYGNIMRDGELPFSVRDFDRNGNWRPEDQRDKPEEGINIIVETEDDDYEIEVEEVAVL